MDILSSEGPTCACCIKVIEPAMAPTRRELKGLALVDPLVAILLIRTTEPPGALHNAVFWINP